MAPPPSATDTVASSVDVVGERFVRALAGQDAAALKAVLRADIDFRAMTPGRFWESRDAEVVVDEMVLGTWFPPVRRITSIVSIEHDRVECVGRVGYRLAVTRPDGDFTVEQQAYYQTDGETIAWLRIMCTGFVGGPPPIGG
jgi:hypothetical protein